MEICSCQFRPDVVQRFHRLWQVHTFLATDWTVKHLQNITCVSLSSHRLYIRDTHLSTLLYKSRIKTNYFKSRIGRANICFNVNDSYPPAFQKYIIKGKTQADNVILCFFPWTVLNEPNRQKIYNILERPRIAIRPETFFGSFLNAGVTLDCHTYLCLLAAVGVQGSRYSGSRAPFSKYLRWNKPCFPSVSIRKKNILWNSGYGVVDFWCEISIC